MTDLPTLEAALKLADQDCPLPSLAGPALKVLRNTMELAAQRLITISYECDRVSVQDTEHRIDQVVDHLRGIRPIGRTDSATLTALIAELRAREALGRAKYGTDVDRTDLNNAQWRQHLREELMDALLYSLAEERTALPSMADLAALGRIRPIRLAEERTRPMEVVDCGGSAPPVMASTIYGVDYGSGDKVVECFGHTDGQGKMLVAQMLESEHATGNTGHGWLRPRPDGVKARCGGPMMCRVCAKEMADLLELPKCWCETCRPVTTRAGMRMVLCPICGNKRCPHVHDHRNACTGSNAVGQPGSSWEHVKPVTTADPGEPS